jgi:Protein of unknown function (DUF3551)
MGIPVLVMVLFIFAVGTGVRAEAQNYPWCAHYGSAFGGPVNCGFSSFGQCMATVSGTGGFCVQNSTYRPVYNTYRPRHRRYPY